eukprot:TRINITY_DN1298_c0_g1_i3.p1 TRINITY_DN1298_c0_g1~~TRINITY_DN1298_c0_g1_i3.p1  ORF type:complete len:122 (-),score=16.93 TRINITY_DN1298_c0_g1_i3:189-554(-)
MKKVIPTVGLNVVRVELSNINLRLWDLSGEAGMRKIWPNYTQDADAIIYCVSGWDANTLQDSKDTFETLVNSNIFRDVPLLLIININTNGQQQIIHEEELRDLFKMQSLCPSFVKEYKVND